MANTKPKQQPAAGSGIGARIPPHNLEAEQAVLCCALIEENAAVTILSELKAEDFYSETNSLIFEHMLMVFNRNTPVDFVTLADELETTGEMQRAGGISYLSSLTNFVPSADNFRHYIEILRKNSVHRRLITAAQDIIEKSFLPVDEDNPEKDFSAMEFAEHAIYSIAEGRDRSSLIPISTPMHQSFAVMEELSKNPGAFRGIPTPYISLNNMINGLCKGDLILIAARPGMGKTSLGMNLVEHAALSGKKCAVFSLEMPGEQLARRMLCSVGLVPMEHASNGRLNSEEWKRLFKARDRLAGSKLFVDDSGSATPVEILSKCRRLKREQGLDVIMIDYLQLMRSGRRREENRTNEVTEITRTLKIAAKELNVPMLLLSQLNRDVEKRKGKPMLSDLRESGSIEQDADIVMFIHREQDENDAGARVAACELIVAKHRNGRTGTVNLEWQGEFTRFKEGASDYAGASLAKAKKEGYEGERAAEGEAPFEAENGKKKDEPMKNIADAEVGDVFGE